jgi:iron complex outermembrane receptor protein
MKNLLQTSLCMAAILMPFSLLAQDSDAIEEVIVSATKKDASAQDVPIALDVLTSDQIDSLNIDTMRDVAARIPALSANYNTDPFQASIRIRGVGSSQSDTSLEAGVAVIVDGVYLNRTGLGLNDLTDIARVEVLQGPQGTLYGKNANAGVVNIVTKKPVIGDDEGFIEIESGDYNQERITGGITKTLSDTSAMRFSFNKNEADGWMKNVADNSTANNEDDTTLSLKLYFNPSDDLSIVFSHSDTSKNGNCCAADSQPNNPVILAGAMVTGKTIQNNDTTDFIFSASDRPQFDLDSSLTSLKIDDERENGTLTTIISRNKYDFYKGVDADFSAVDLANSDRNIGGSSLSTEIRFASDMIGNWEYLIGVYHYTSDLYENGDKTVSIGADWDPTFAAVMAGLNANIAQLTQAVQAGLAPASQLQALVAQATSTGGLVAFVNSGDRIENDMKWDDSLLAIFGSATNHISDTLRLTTGLRFSTETKEADLYAGTILPGTMVLSSTIAAALGNPALAGATIPRQSIAANWPLNGFMNPVDDLFKREKDSTTYSISLQKDLADDVMVYTSYATGFKSGGFNSTGGDDSYPREYKDEESKNFEVGIKSRINDGKTQVNATVFNMETDGLQGVLQVPSGTGTAVYNSTIPAKRLGLDLSVIHKFSQNLIVNLGYMNVDDDDADISTNAAIRLTPKMAYNVGLSHFMPLGNGKVHTRIDYSYDDEMEVTANYSTSPAMATLPASYKEMRDRENLNAKIAWSNDQWEVAYWIKNGTDQLFERLVTSPSPVAGGNFAVFMMKPKTQGLSVKYNF